MHLYTVKSPNIAWPLTLRTSQSDYAVTAKVVHFIILLLSRGGFPQKLANVVKIFLTLIQMTQSSNYLLLNQVIDEVNC